MGEYTNRKNIIPQEAGLVSRDSIVSINNQLRSTVDAYLSTW